ncbi:MAG TPA: M3 family metallopeptidase, partial [Kofleriaceae bacterium]|nr:M3 family metallopeptidase [Kofleriaceae bacterium]
MRKLFVLVLAAACGGPSKPIPAPTAPPEPPVAMPVAPPSPAVTEQAPPLADRFLTECRAPIAEAQRTLAALKAVKTGRSTEDVLEGYNEISRFAANAGNLAGLMKNVHPDKAVREAAQTCESEVQKFLTNLLLDRDVFDMFKAIDPKPLDADTKRYVAFTLRDYHRQGVDLDDAKRTRIREIEDEITQLGQKFEAGIAEDTRYIEIKDPARLGGMPADWIAAHKPDAQGVIKISTDYPDYIPFMAHASDDDLRKQLYVQFRLRGSAHNEEYLGKILVLRAEKAKMLGFKDWADYQSDDKMLKGGKPAHAFVDRVEKLADARAKRDYAELLKQLQTHDKSAKVVNDWQRAWLEDQVKRAKYAVDSNQVRTYFDYDTALGGLLDIT